jgi:hypothetical protein
MTQEIVKTLVIGVLLRGRFWRLRRGAGLNWQLACFNLCEDGLGGV